MKTIPFNRPRITGNEIQYLRQSIEHGHLAGDGPFTKKCQALLEKKFTAKKVLLTHSCTAALELAALACGLEPGDEVILPSYTFTSTANAFLLRGARLVFVDIRPDTLNMDETLIEDKITPRTKVICVVHYAGVACEMTPILKMARKHKLLVIEDAAQGVASIYRGRFLGTIGDFGTFSFHETKNYTSGEGGAILVNNEDLIEITETAREKGTNRSQFLRGEVDKYTWVSPGSSYLPSDLVAAFLLAQLEEMEYIAQARKSVYCRYSQALSFLADQNLVRFLSIPGHCQSNYHLFCMLLSDETSRNALLDFLKSRGVQAGFHYIPLHLSPMGRAMGYGTGDLPVTESMSRCLVRLPLYCDLSEPDQGEIIRRITDFFTL